MALFKILFLVSGIACAPQSSFPRIDVLDLLKVFKKRATQLIAMSRWPSAPSLHPARQPWRMSILNEGSKEAAVGEATRAYITAFNSGERYEKGGACEAAERAWKDARASVGKDHVLEATLAFIKKWPGVEDGNPCAVAGTDYVKEILAGNSHDDATSAAMRAFIRAFKQRANKGATLNDEACHKASRAFFDAVPQKSDPIIGAGFTAFSDKLFAGIGVVYDPVCLEAMESFIDSHSAGDNLLTSSLKAARSFLKAFIS